jgi:hypothetical protein
VEVMAVGVIGPHSWHFKPGILMAEKVQGA